MMHILLLFVCFLFLELGNSVESQDLFSDYDNNNGNSVGSLDFEPLALGDSGSVAQQVDFLDFNDNITPNTNLWSLSDDSPMSFDTSGDEIKNADLTAAGCSSSNNLGKRNEETSCPDPNKETVHIPTFEEMMGAVEALHETLEDKICSPPRLFHLCCICGGFNGFGLCDKCEQCKLAFLHISTAA